jgi:hypothetical protein
MFSYIVRASFVDRSRVFRALRVCNGANGQPSGFVCENHLIGFAFCFAFPFFSPLLFRVLEMGGLGFFSAFVSDVSLRA